MRTVDGGDVMLHPPASHMRSQSPLWGYHATQRVNDGRRRHHEPYPKEGDTV
jgi:hypothetical protein